jgi:hypothetical protein
VYHWFEFVTEKTILNILVRSEEILYYNIQLGFNGLLHVAFVFAPNIKSTMSYLLEKVLKM